MSDPTYGRIRRGILRVALIATAVLAAGLCVELVLRVSWCNSASSVYEYQSGPFLVDNPYWGNWHYANREVEHRRTCFDARYRTNEFGMRGDRVREGATKIALLGDSFVEGYGNDNDATAARFMEKSLGPKFQVLNFGVSGFFSTVDELALYDGLAKFFDPKIVILFFLNYNDLEDLLNADKARYVDDKLNFIYRRPQSFDEVVAAIRSKSPPSDSAAGEERSCTSRFLDQAGKVAGHRMEMVINFRWDFSHELARPYLPAEEPPTTRAWSIVEASLRRLAELTRANGSTLLIVDIADPFQLDANWLRLTSLREGTKLSPTQPNQRLGAICVKLGIRYYDLYPETSAYVREHGLRYPFLSFRCDRHYDPVGQNVMATLVTGYLRRENLLGE